MRPVVNLLWCRPGKVGGSEEYLARQLVGLHAAAPDISPRLVVPPGFVEAHPELSDLESSVGPVWTAGRTGRLAAELTWLPRRLRGGDLVHHGGGTVPARSPRPVVLTIHDIQYVAYPQYFSAARLRYLRAAMPPSVQRARVVAVPSEFVKATVVDTFGADRDAVVVVPHGVDVAPAERRPSEAVLRQRYGLGDRRVLVFPAITHPHKGHRFLLDVVAAAWTHPDIVVVLLGGEGSAESDVRAAIDRLGLAGRVVRPGRVPSDDRDGLIALAEALVFPSEYEGFGAPVLEAMALGTPVVCSDAPALAEVAGDAAVVRPLDVDAWAGALDAVGAERVELIERGRARAAGFTTAISGAALARAYRLALS